MIFDLTITSTNGFGIFLTLVGGVWYTYVMVAGWRGRRERAEGVTGRDGTEWDGIMMTPRRYVELKEKARKSMIQLPAKQEPMISIVTPKSELVSYATVQ